jgi:hypothetical protein
MPDAAVEVELTVGQEARKVFTEMGYSNEIVDILVFHRLVDHDIISREGENYVPYILAEELRKQLEKEKTYERALARAEEDIERTESCLEESHDRINELLEAFAHAQTKE